MPAKGSIRNDMGAYGGQSYQSLFGPIHIEEPMDSMMVGLALHDQYSNPNFDLVYANGLLEIKMNKNEYVCISAISQSGSLLEMLYKGQLVKGKHYFRLSNPGMQVINIKNNTGLQLSRLVIGQ